MPTATLEPSARTQTQTLKAAVIGLGVGERHIDAYRAYPSSEIVIACDTDPQKRAEITDRHPDLEIAANADVVLDDPAIDIVSIATYDDVHGAQVIRALANGKHVFVEKPLCVNPEEAREIRRLLRIRPDLRLSSNLVLRRSPRFRLVRSMVERGDLGRIFHMDASYDYGRVQKLTNGWRGAIPGYSVVLGGGVHVIDLLLWISGRRITDVACFANGIATAGTPYDGDDMVTALARFEDGTTATITANFACVRPHSHGLTVCGTRATFVNDTPDGRLYTSRDPSQLPSPVTAAHPGAAKGDLIASFLDSILGHGEAEVTADDAFAALSVCFAIERARLEGTIVPVEYI